MNLESRLKKLEGKAAPVRWHHFVQEVGQTFAEAKAKYELKNGSIPEEDSILVDVLVRPAIRK